MIGFRSTKWVELQQKYYKTINSKKFGEVMACSINKEIMEHLMEYVKAQELDTNWVVSKRRERKEKL